MNLSVEDLRQAVHIVSDVGGAEAAIVGQLVLDLAVTAKFSATGDVITVDMVRRLLQLRIARHRAANYRMSGTVH